TSTPRHSDAATTVYNSSNMPAQPGRDSAAAVAPKLEIQAAVARIVREQLPDAAGVTVTVERPRDASHGDYATHVALVLAKAARRNPREPDATIGTALGAALPNLIDAPQVAGPGFLNVTLKDAARQRGGAAAPPARARLSRRGDARGTAR